MAHRAIAIDGPSGAGKSTLARAVAQGLGFLYVDTGAIYRTVALAALESGVSPEDEAAVEALLPTLSIALDYGADGLQRMYLQGREVTGAIRAHPVSEATSQLAALPQVRAFLLETQRRLAREHDVVMDGRDIGTVVLPEAEVKIFLTADPEDRARRRYEELCQRGDRPDFSQLLRDVVDRDWRDAHRSVSPLRQAEDAILVDTTGQTLEESRARLLTLIEEALRG